MNICPSDASQSRYCVHQRVMYHSRADRGMPFGQDSQDPYKYLFSTATSFSFRGQSTTSADQCFVDVFSARQCSIRLQAQCIYFLSMKDLILGLRTKAYRGNMALYICAGFLYARRSSGLEKVLLFVTDLLQLFWPLAGAQVLSLKVTLWHQRDSVAEHCKATHFVCG